MTTNNTIKSACRLPDIDINQVLTPAQRQAGFQLCKTPFNVSLVLRGVAVAVFDHTVTIADLRREVDGWIPRDAVSELTINGGITVGVK
jgi:hypothetical protein